MPDRAVSIAFQTDKPIAAYGPLAAAAERYGFGGVTVYNDLLFQPAWLPLLEIARNTKKVRIGPAAVNPFTCHPLNIAGNIALIDEASQGRAYLGLARGSWLNFLGIEPDQPLTALREALACIRHLLNGSTQPYEGKVFSLAGGESLRWKVVRSNIPFLLGTWGPKTVKACIDHITEIKIGGTANPAVISQMQTAITDAAIQANRDPAEIKLVIGAVTVVDSDGQTARALARREAALYLPIVAQLDQSLNIEPELFKCIKAAAEAHDYDQVARNISDDLLRRLAFAGTPDEVAEQAIDLFNAGTHRVEFGTPHGVTPEEGMRLLGERVLPALSVLREEKT